MRPPHPVQRFVAPQGAPPKAQVAKFACVRPTQYKAVWPHRKPHRRHKWRRSHAPAPANSAFRCPTGSSTEGPRGDVRVCPLYAVQRSVSP
eukprot:7522475-Pyramimonas_sp.AAC.1